MTLREKIEVMEAFERGEEIEHFSLMEEIWTKTAIPDWDWALYEYRIKPKPQKIITIEKWLVTNKKRFDVVETSDIDAYLGEGCGWDKVKLLDTYEVEL